MMIKEQRVVVYVTLYTDKDTTNSFNVVRNQLNDAVHKVLFSVAKNNFLFRDIKIEVMGYES